MKACIIYGWAEGSAHGKRFRAALRDAGFEITRRAQEADVLIVHSGGCFLIPDESRAQLVLLVGMPYWPGKHPSRSLTAKVRHELHDLAWYRKTFFNVTYLLLRPRSWVRMWRGWKKQLLPQLADHSVLLVRNEHDTFMHPTDIETLAKERSWKLTALPGHHDDLWSNPKAYIRLIKENLPSTGPRT